MVRKKKRRGLLLSYIGQSVDDRDSSNPYRAFLNPLVFCFSEEINRFLTFKPAPTQHLFLSFS